MNRRAWAGPLALGLLALAARWPGLGRSLWYDELTTLTASARSPLAAFTVQVQANTHPLASLLAWGAALLGQSEQVLRAPFALLGAAAAVALLAGRRALGGRAAWLGAALAVLAPAHVLASQQVRGYAPLLLAAALLPPALLRARALAGPGPLLALGALAALGALGHFTLLVPALALAAWSALASPARRAPTAALLAGLGGALLLALGLLARTWKYVRRALTAGDPGAPGRLGPGDWLELLGGPGPLGLALGALLLVLAGWGWRELRRAGRREAAAAWLLAALSPLVLLALGAPAYPRLLLAGLPACLALAGVGLARLAPAPRAAALLLALALQTAGSARQAGEELQDLRGAVALARAGGGPVLACGHAGQVLRAYAPELEVLDDPAALPARLAQGPAAVIEPFPAWTPPEVRAALWREAGTPWLLRGRAADVLVYPRGASRNPSLGR